MAAWCDQQGKAIPTGAKLVERDVMVILILGFIFLTHRAAVQRVQADEGGYSHIRFGHITWKMDESGAPNTAHITFDSQDDWIMARALQPGSATNEYLTHKYPGAGPYTLYSQNC